MANSYYTTLQLRQMPREIIVSVQLCRRAAGPLQRVAHSSCPSHGARRAIDPSPIINIDGIIYVAYRVDGSNYGHGGICGNTVPPLVDTPVLLQRLAEDAIIPVGPPVDIMDRTRDDGPPVEAPALVRSDEGVHFLFFGSGCIRMPSYDLDYATSTKSMAHTSVPPDRC